MDLLHKACGSQLIDNGFCVTPHEKTVCGEVVYSFTCNLCGKELDAEEAAIYNEYLQALSTPMWKRAAAQQSSDSLLSQDELNDILSLL